jgi:hypothetical protein
LPALRYRAYGLSFACDVSLPELSGAADDENSAPPEVRIRLGSRSPRAVNLRPLELLFTRTVDQQRRWLACSRVRDGYLLRFLWKADFHISRDGCEIACVRRAPWTPLSSVRHLLLDQVFPMVLNLRGREAIHATAVMVRGGAVAFLGPAGAGKSTLAASFLLAGHRALGDDCLVLEARRAIRAVPAYPGFRLWNDSAQALGTDTSAAMPVAAYTAKVRMLSRECGADFPGGPVPLRRIYRLIRGRCERKKIRVPAVEALAPRDALIELVSATFPLDVRDQGMLERHFRVMQRVASEIPVLRVLIPDDFAALPAVRQAILRDLSGS